MRRSEGDRDGGSDRYPGGGQKADMILFDPGHLKSFPNHDSEATVAYASSVYTSSLYISSEEKIDTMIVNGKVVYHKGLFAGGLSENELIREIAVEGEKILADSGNCRKEV